MGKCKHAQFYNPSERRRVHSAQEVIDISSWIGSSCDRPLWEVNMDAHKREGQTNTDQWPTTPVTTSSKEKYCLILVFTCTWRGLIGQLNNNNKKKLPHFFLWYSKSRHVESASSCWSCILKNMGEKKKNERKKMKWVIKDKLWEQFLERLGVCCERTEETKVIIINPVYTCTSLVLMGFFSHILS